VANTGARGSEAEEVEVKQALDIPGRGRTLYCSCIVRRGGGAPSELLRRSSCPP
jgi:hypothetical protein